MTPIADLYEFIRALLGDFHSVHKRYEDTAIRSVVRTVVLAGLVKGYTLTPDKNSITPDVVATPKAFAQVTFHAALKLLLPNVASYAYDTRELKERFGEQSKFLVALSEQLFDLENPEVFATQQNFSAWVNGMTGLNVYAELTDLYVNAPVGSATVGQNGISSSG